MPKQKRLITKKSVKKGTSKAVAARPKGGKTKGDLHKPGTLGRGGMIRCEGCSAVYFDKHWHSPSVLAGDIDLSWLAKGLCEECKMAKKKSSGATTYAGEVTIDGEFSPKEKSEILGIIRNVGKRATRRDPMDRVVRIAESGGALRVYTTENQLAVAIGKQIHHARKGGTLTITWSEGDKLARVHWHRKA
jgi:hypothetical protein